MAWPYTYWTFTKLPVIIWSRSQNIADLSRARLGDHWWTTASTANGYLLGWSFAILIVLVIVPILLPIAMVRDLCLPEKKVIATEQALERRTQRCLPQDTYPWRN